MALGEIQNPQFSRWRDPTTITPQQRSNILIKLSPLIPPCSHSPEVHHASWNGSGRQLLVKSWFCLVFTVGGSQARNQPRVPMADGFNGSSPAPAEPSQSMSSSASVLWFQSSRELLQTALPMGKEKSVWWAQGIHSSWKSSHPTEQRVSGTEAYTALGTSGNSS